MYWTDGTDDRIYRANLDGTSRETLHTSTGNNPRGISLDIINGKMYWADNVLDKIQRANFNGSNVEDVATGLTSPIGVAVDAAAGKVYWTDLSTDKIQRANVDGTNAEDVLTGLPSPQHIALDTDNGKMYWVDNIDDKIYRANLDGTVVEEVITTGLTSPYGITVDPSGGKIYWSDNSTDKISRANLDGTNVEDIVTGQSNARGLAVNYNPAQLPVELTSFEALLNNNTVKLTWQTATEVNNYGFEIERQQSENGTLNTEWETIGFVKGHGNSNSPKSYEFIDANPPSGNLQYRLKQIDTDGTFEYYGTTADANINVTSVLENQSAGGLPSEFNLEQNYPNPFNPETRIRYSLPLESMINIAVYNTLGQQIELLENKIKTAGTHELNFDASNLSSGVYIYKMSAEATDGSNRFSKINKMLLLR